MDWAKNALRYKDAAETSLAAYENRLKMLLGEVGKEEGIAQLKDTATVMEFLASKKVTTRRNYISAILRLFHGLGVEENGLKEELEFYTEQLNELTKKIPRRELEDYPGVNLATLRETLAKRRADVERVDPKIRPKMSEWQFISDWFICELYINLAPRRVQDYMDMKLEDDGESNWFDEVNMEMTFRKYKTLKKYGVQTFSMRGRDDFEAIWKIWRRHRKYRPGPYMICSLAGKKVYNSRMNDAFRRIFGMKIGPTVMRHMYVSAFHGSVEEIGELSKWMGHSLDEQQRYVLQ